MHNLLEQYPNSTEVVKNWFMELMIESLNDDSVPEDFKEYMRQQGIDNDKLAKIIESNPRVLFDVFDANGVIINVVYTENGFTWDIGHVKNIQFYSSRKGAEMDAIETAFKMLDDKLNVIISETPNDEGQDSTTGDSEVPAEK